MKRIIYCSIYVLLLMVMNSCTKFLDLQPQDEIVDADFWSTANDLKLYTNQFYSAFPVHEGYSGGTFWLDNNSDNMITGTYNRRLAGENTLNNSSGNWNFMTIRNWDFQRIRAVNYGIENGGRMLGTVSNIEVFLGELHFFRAFLYFNLLKTYGDVPWLSKPINIDSDELFAPRTRRDLVVDSMLADLDIAIDFLPLKGAASPNRLNKECALLYKSRVALYEGTWEKYHSGTPFGVEGSTGQKYLELSAQASMALIELGTMELYAGAGPDDYFISMFGGKDLSSNPEVLLWKKYDRSLGLSHKLQHHALHQGGNTGLSKSLVDEFLCKDGNPIATSPLYEGDNTLLDVTANRDPRLAQTIWVPGDVWSVDGSAVQHVFERPWIDRNGELRCTSGYQLKKGSSWLQNGVADEETAAIVFRYAEAFLNYAEARAELGLLDQADLDASINKLRDRVDLPHLNMNAIPHDPNWFFPGVSPVINEIRRERRVELACEGFRFDDLCRWAAMDLLVGEPLLGAKFDHSEFPNLEPGKNILLNADGYLDPYQVSLPNNIQFVTSRDYLLPLPQLELTLNENLTQNPGWE